MLGGGRTRASVFFFFYKKSKSKARIIFCSFVRGGGGWFKGLGRGLE